MSARSRFPRPQQRHPRKQRRLTAKDGGDESELEQADQQAGQAADHDRGLSDYSEVRLCFARLDTALRPTRLGIFLTWSRSPDCAAARLSGAASHKEPVVGRGHEDPTHG